MIATKELLEQYGLWNKLPNELKNLEDGKYFAFYYDVKEDSETLNVYEYSVVAKVNESLYRDISERAKKFQSATISLGFFSNTLETRDGLFYLFLRTYNPADAVSRFYDFALDRDKSIDVAVSTNAITKIFNSDNFRTSVSYFFRSKAKEIMYVYDMVHDAFEKKLGSGLYGSRLTKVVSLIRYDGGVLPEINGRLRFMVIGENKANLTTEQKENLYEAKLLLRSFVDPLTIYTKTGWAFSELDGKWRTNISDEDAKLSQAMMYDVDGRKMYIPSGFTSANIYSMLKDPISLYNFKYTGMLKDVLDHKNLYKYYPKLATLPILYFYGENKSAGGPRFYFSENERGGYIVINGFPECGNSLSILLHEIQHAIQNIEGFATGGNEFFAQFVVALGGDSVRRIFTSINRLERMFKDRMINDESREELLQALKGQLANTAGSRQLKNMLIPYLQTKEAYEIEVKTVTFYTILFIAENGDYTSNDVTLLLQRKLGDEVFELFNNISEAYGQAKKYKEKLSSENYRDEDMSHILFKQYENLYGEMESRSTQASRLVGSTFRNYFFLTSWEHSPMQNLTVIDGEELIWDSKMIKAAVEDKAGEYVLHFEKGFSSIPALHELGHIVHDGLLAAGYKEKVEDAFEQNVDFLDESEFVVARFLGYLKEKVLPPEMSRDLQYDFTIGTDEMMNQIFDEFFDTQDA